MRLSIHLKCINNILLYTILYIFGCVYRIYIGYIKSRCQRPVSTRTFWKSEASNHSYNKAWCFNKMVAQFTLPSYVADIFVCRHTQLFVRFCLKYKVNTTKNRGSQPFSTYLILSFKTIIFLFFYCRCKKNLKKHDFKL